MTRGELSQIWGRETPESQERIASNCAQILQRIVANSRDRVAFSVDLVRRWHRGAYAGVKTDPDYPLGAFCGSSASKSLQECNVAVGNIPGVLAERVATELRRVERAMARRIGDLDAESPGDVREAATVLKVAELAAFAHGEWVRIHPFADGNGRTARLLCNWILIRYGLPPVLRLRPRPDSLEYACASQQSMATGDHNSTQRYILDQLNRRFELGGR